MKERVRRIILFAVIVITGSVMILFDIPLTIMIPLIIVVGFGILLLLGAITVAEISTALANLKPANIKKIGIIKRLDEMKFFEKPAPASPDKKPAQKTVVQPPAKVPDKKTGIGARLSSFISSVGSLRTLLQARSKPGKKAEDINKLLDKTVSEKVEKSPSSASTRTVADTSLPSLAGGAGAAAQGQDQDPFLSLSGDEFDAGLLDSLDDMEGPSPAKADAESTPPGLPDAPGPDISEPAIPLPSLDMDGEAGNILMENAQGLEEFSSLDGGGIIDQDLGDLDNMTLDDVELDLGDEDITPPGSSPPSAAAAGGKTASPALGAEPVKTDWIQSDAPKNAGQAGDQVSTQADMAAFSSGRSSDADMLSSLAADVKHVQKKVDLSLLRELKDFRAPGTDIEKELSDMAARLNMIPGGDKKAKPPAGGMK